MLIIDAVLILDNIVHFEDRKIPTESQTKSKERLPLCAYHSSSETFCLLLQSNANLFFYLRAYILLGFVYFQTSLMPGNTPLSLSLSLSFSLDLSSV